MTLFPLRSVLTLSLLFSLAACTDGGDGKDTDTGEMPGDEVCDNGVDDDEDGATDCDDSDCADDPACQEPGVETACADGADNDDDGAIDCDDTDCADDPVCDTTTETRCADGADDDGDSLIDCDDPDCDDDQACAESVESICDDSLDNDEDGATDCDDSDCAADPACATVTSETVCDDGLDDDEDGATDCDDDDCAGDPACAAPTTEVNCDDGLDDDGDRLFDCDDDDCAEDPACEAPDMELVCDDEVDDDGDGATDCDDEDCAEDPACLVSVGELICDDGVDDDGDGLTDCDDDDCAGFEACAVEPELYCEDGIDDDGDGAVDCDDSDCEGVFPCTPSVCDETDLGSALGEAIATGTTDGAGDDHEPSCGGSGAPEVTFRWTAPADGTYSVTSYGTSWDTTLTLFTEACAEELDCDDDGGASLDSAITFDAAEGEVVSFALGGYNDDDFGEYTLNVYAASELSCTDGADDDDDGRIDCEDRDCAEAAVCIPEPVCDDGLDDDEDGAIDCDDEDCADDFACVYPCADEDLGGRVGASAASGTTAGESDDATPSCGEGSAAPDRTLLWTAPADATYTFSTSGSGFDTVLSMQSPDCSGSELECSDDIADDDAGSEITRAFSAGESVLLVVDGAADESGEFVVDITAGSEVVCDDGADEDLDGATDCDDSDCVDTPACNPETVCDDVADGPDEDGLIDCLDEDCAEDAVCDTSRADFDLGSATGDAVATGSTTGMVDDTMLFCISSSTAEDVLYAWVAPSTGDWTFDLSGSSYDTGLSIIGADGGERDCNDDGGEGTTSLATVSLNEGELVFVNVDGYSTRSGDYVLSIYEATSE